MPTHARTRLPEWRITSWCNWVRKVKREEAREKGKVTVWVRRLNGSELGRKMGVKDRGAWSSASRVRWFPFAVKLSNVQPHSVSFFFPSTRRPLFNIHFYLRRCGFSVEEEIVTLYTE
ncbi:uncharacterized protein BO87DRAFT_73137 [Aspergillus neoniger CBS 115656]|uniref:Uncharacterized protein n=1 Tax=Aspergillus neoniger (strain CBS 115656) TaxID=1448310 RepID=A0A318YGW3_ASPNB|nr:hypothetical protein BO87DRAFT_73137 [Aspergillus neoniger CBS 115656]PYH33596.1 hypothetical protein BO87DRAFT_73137 [Aspergillus neoniger CBS 115656]